MPKNLHKSKIKKWFSVKKRLFIWLPITILLLIFASLPIFSLNGIKSESVSFTRESVEDPNIELNETKVIQNGSVGSKDVTYRYSRSLFNILFGGHSTEGQIVTTEAKSKPVNEVTANGTRKYQYMYCTNGVYRYYTDEQFKDKNTGFTHKSKDICQENGQGAMTQLADGAPGTNQANTYVSAYIPSNCSKIPIPYTTSYQNVSYLSAGQTQSSGGYDGYKVTCTVSSTGYKSPDYTIQPINKITYVGTGVSSNSGNSKASSAAARQKCTADYNSAKAQISAAGAGSSSAMDQLNVLYSQCLSRAG